VSDSAAFQEVDDAVRQDDLKLWWKRWGTWVVAGAVLVVVAVAGLVGWRQYDASRRAEASAAYSATLAQIAQDRPAALKNAVFFEPVSVSSAAIFTNAPPFTE